MIQEDAGTPRANVCTAAESAGLRTLILLYDLDGAFRVACF